MNQEIGLDTTLAMTQKLQLTNNNMNIKDFLDFIKEFWLIIITIVWFSAIVFGSYLQSCKQAHIFNMIHNTSWTCYDFLLAKDQINSSTQTININNMTVQ